MTNNFNKKRYEKLAALFDKACDLSVDEQADFVQRACPDDPDMQKSLLDMLAADRDPSIDLSAEAGDKAFRDILGKSRDEVRNDLKIMDRTPDDGPKH